MIYIFFFLQKVSLLDILFRLCPCFFFFLGGGGGGGGFQKIKQHLFQIVSPLDNLNKISILFSVKNKNIF